MVEILTGSVRAVRVGQQGVTVVFCRLGVVGHRYTFAHTPNQSYTDSPVWILTASSACVEASTPGIEAPDQANLSTHTPVKGIERHGRRAKSTTHKHTNYVVSVGFSNSWQASIHFTESLILVLLARAVYPLTNEHATRLFVVGRSLGVASPSWALALSLRERFHWVGQRSNARHSIPYCPGFDRAPGMCLPYLCVVAVSI